MSIFNRAVSRSISESTAMVRMDLSRRLYWDKVSRGRIYLGLGRVCGSQSAFHWRWLAAACFDHGRNGTHYCSMSFRYCFERLPRILDTGDRKSGGWLAWDS